MTFGEISALIVSKGSITIGAAVLHILEAVDAEGDAEAGPEHGEAEGARHRPGHHAWPTVCCSCHTCLKESMIRMQHFPAKNHCTWQEEQTTLADFGPKFGAGR